MATTTVKVAVRVRPMTVKETLEGATECILHLPKSPQVVIGIPDNSQTQKSFTFDNVFSPNAEQDEIYASCVEPLIEKFLLGFNATILAYGQTGSGKTYSMGTGFEENISPEQRGLLQFMGIIYLSGMVPRAIVQIFSILAQESAKDPEFESFVSVSFLELYNEELVDLLAPKGKNVNGPSIRENAFGKIVWSGITEETVASPEALFEVLNRGSLCRTTGSTDMNAVSSRSHAIFSVSLTQIKKSESNTCNSNDELSEGLGNEQDDECRRKLVSKFHFVDLAGSERLKKTNAEGERKKEGISINQGLLALGNVISALGDETRKVGHVPYRDSKLTRMLQDSLGGNSQTLMLACVSPSDANYSESLNTLHYANRAKNIKNKVTINEDANSASNNAEIRSLRGLVLQLRTELAMLKPEGASSLYDRLREDLQPPDDASLEPKFFMQREKELVRDLEESKKEIEISKIEHDRLVFLCNRLAQRNREASQEIFETLQERDKSIIDKCRQLCSFSGKYFQSSGAYHLPKEQAHVREKSENGLEIIDTGQEVLNDEAFSEIGKLFHGYRMSNAELRSRLMEAQDQILWCSDFFNKIGKQGQSNSLTHDAIRNMMQPTNKRLEDIKEPIKDDSFFENRILRALKENSLKYDLSATENVNDASNNNESETASGNKVRFFGLPKILTAATFPSQMNVETTPADPSIAKDFGMGGDSDMYTLLHKIQTDISVHEDLMDKKLRRDAEYEMMKKGYEQKINNLNHQLQQYLKERDLALKMFKDPVKNKKEAVKASIITATYEERKRKLQIELSETKRKYEESVRIQAERTSRNAALCRGLQAEIEAMKNEKLRILKQLRKETQAKLEISTESQREIAKWKRKGQDAYDVNKKLEKNNQLQRLLLKKKNEEVMSTHHKLKNVYAILKQQNNYSSKFLKAKSSYMGSSGKQLSRISRPNSRHFQKSPYYKDRPLSKGSIGPDFEMQSRLKYDLVQQELSTCIKTRQFKKAVKDLIEDSANYKKERDALLEERSAIVTAIFKETGVYDITSPQYMDQRLNIIESELATIESKKRVTEEQLLRSGSITDLASFENSLEHEEDPFINSQQIDLPWENCLRLIQSFNHKVLEDVSSWVLSDFVSAKLESLEKDSIIEKCNKKISQIRFRFGQYKFKVQEALSNPSPEFSTNTGDECIRDLNQMRIDIDSEGNLSSINSSQEFSQSVSLQRQEDVLAEDQIFSDKIVHSNSQDLSDKMQNFGFKPTTGLSGDVFERLAHSHTRASQAKVIPRLTSFIDRELPDA